MRQPSKTASAPLPAPAPFPIAYIPVKPRRRRRPPLVQLPPPRKKGDNGEKIIKVARIDKGLQKLPMIRMQGAWLERLGFAINSRLMISEEKGRLVLTLEPEPQGAQQ